MPNKIQTHTINTLYKGLRPSKRMPRNSEYLITCKGAVGLDNVLQTLTQIARLDTSALSVSFPYPQIFVFNRVIIICTSTKIYEWVSAALVEKLTVTAGSTWSAVDFNEYVYLTNGIVAVERSASTQAYAVTTALPKGMSLCNFNGQVFVAAPDAGIT